MNSEPFDLSAFSTTGAPSTQEPLTFERMSRMIQELREQYPEPNTTWLISPRTYNQLQRMGARARRQHRAWLRAKRQRRARQRRHNRGLA